MDYPKFNLYDLATLAVAIDHQREVARSEYLDRLNHLDKLSRMVRQYVDAYTEEKGEELEERGFFPEEHEEREDDEEIPLF